MNLDPGPALNRAQTVVHGRVAAIPRIVVALMVFGGFLVLAAIVKGVVARLTEARLHAHRHAGVAVGDSLRAWSSVSAWSLRSPSPCRRSGQETSCRSLASGASPSGLRSGTSSRIFPRRSCSSSPSRSATEDSDGDRARQREGWPAGNTDAPASRTVADAIRHLSGSEPRGAEGE